MKFKEGFKKFWHLLWEDDSMKGWIFSIIFLFIFIKFIFFPTLNFLTGSPLSLAIVESCSMYHKSDLNYNFGDWFNDHRLKYASIGINESQFEEYKFKNGFNKGDILFTVKAVPEKLKIGDVIIFNAGQRNPVIHRIIKIESENGSYTFSTVGDNNNGQLTFERGIKEEQLIGKASFRLAPLLGWGKLIFYDWKKVPSERGFCSQN